MNNSLSISIVPLSVYEEDSPFFTEKEHPSNVTILNTVFDSNKDQFGSAILYFGSEGSTFLTRNCTFKSNGCEGVCETGAAGAMMLETLGEITIEDTVFDSNNAVDEGGALSIYSVNDKTTIINNCTFKSNYLNTDYDSQGYGGAVKIISMGDVIINNTNFDSNSAWRGAAVDIESIGNINITNDNFTSNNAISNSILNIRLIDDDMLEYYKEILNREEFTRKHNIFMDNCKFTENTVESLDNLTDNAVLSIASSNNTIINNSIFDYNDITNGGCVYIQSNGETLISNSEFTSNRATNEEEVYTKQYQEHVFTVMKK